jgi:hypothetical protein
MDRKKKECVHSSWKIQLDHLKLQIFTLLKKYGIPASKTGRIKDSNWLAHQNVNTELLELLPVYEEIIQDRQKTMNKLLELDHTGRPIGLTPYGHQFMSQW